MVQKKGKPNFKKIYIEITNVCNLTCSFCPLTKRNMAFVTVENFKIILERITGYTDYLYLHVKGEPLLHPQLDEILKLSNEQGFEVNLTTNGTLINKVGDILLNNPALRQISFSLQSFENHLNIEMKNDYIKDILEFTKKAIEKTELIIEFRMWNLDVNGEKNLKKKNEYMLEAIEKSLRLPFKIEEKVSPGKGIKLAERIYLSQSYEFVWPNLEREIVSDNGFCYGLRNQIAILVDGTVIPCCLDSEGNINLGNIYVEAFADILESERVKDIINGFSNRKVVEQLCKRCGYRTKFDI